MIGGMSAAAPERASRPRLAPWRVAVAVVAEVDAGRDRASARVGLLLTALLLVQLGCGNRQVAAGPGCALTIVIDKEFVKRHSRYQPWPDLGIIFDHTNGVVQEAGGDPRGIVMVLALAVSVVLVAETVGLPYHNLHGVQISLTVSGNGEPRLVFVSAPLHWGENRVLIPDSALAPLMAGTAALHLDAAGTREVSLSLPTTDVEWSRAAHAITLAADGRLIVDGEAVDIPKAMAPEPAPTLGPLRGRL